MGIILFDFVLPVAGKEALAADGCCRAGGGKREDSKAVLELPRESEAKDN